MRENKAREARRFLRLYMQGSPSGCVRREIPGVTQVDQKGHEGNTAVVTAYHIYVGGNMVKETARQEEFLLTTIINCDYYSKTSGTPNYASAGPV